jgi:hypothetical protein
MTKKAIIQLKALFLLLVFFMNAAVGTACALAPHDCCHKHVSHNCCTDSVLKFQQLDKSFEQHLTTVMDVPVLNITTHFITPSFIYRNYPYPIFRQELPPRDIRVSIQSFQI